jgi:small subunit ribosomal protein S6
VYYETTFIVNPDVSQEKTQELTDQLIGKIEKAGGRIVKREYWGIRLLSYPIEKRKRGHYTLLVTDGEAAAIEALEHAIQLEERILRFLTIRLDELSDEPSPLMRRRKAREERAAEMEAEAEAEAEAGNTPEAAAAEATSESAPEATADKAESTETAPEATADKGEAAGA